MSDDHWAISNLLARYAELLNLGRIDEVGELFRYGKITSVGNPMTYTGTDEVVAMYRDSVHFDEKVPDTLIFTTNLQIEVDGDAATSQRVLPRRPPGRPGSGAGARGALPRRVRAARRPVVVPPPAHAPRPRRRPLDPPQPPARGLPRGVSAVPYRLIQWGTGNVGRHALRTIVERPDFELVGVRVYNPDKVGTGRRRRCSASNQPACSRPTTSTPCSRSTPTASATRRSARRSTTTRNRSTTCAGSSSRARTSCRARSSTTRTSNPASRRTESATRANGSPRRAARAARASTTWASTRDSRWTSGRSRCRACVAASTGSRSSSSSTCSATRRCRSCATTSASACRPTSRRRSTASSPTSTNRRSTSRCA